MTSDNHEKILQAAFTVLSRQGYEHTSIKDIAEAAGVAQGLVHYYFKSKQQLVLAVLMAVCSKMELQGAEGEAGARAAFDNFKALLKSNRETHALYLQLISVGFHDSEVGAGVLEFMRTDRGHVEALARQVLAQREVDPAPAPAIASVVWGAILGIMVQNLIDPDFNGDEAVDALAAMSLTAAYPPAQGLSARL